MYSNTGRCRISLLSLIYIVLSVFASLPADAQAVPWTKNDINSGSSGVFTYTAGSPPQYQISGSGTGVGAVDDSFCYVSTPCTQSNYVQGKVVSQTNTGAGALAGFCIRDSVQTSYAYSYVLAVTPGSGITFSRRYQGGANSTIATAAGTAPIYLKLARNGSAATGYTVSAYSSSTGTNWTLIGSAGEANTNPMPNKMTFGFVVSSTVNGATQSTAVFSNVSTCMTVPQPSSNLLLWLKSDDGISATGSNVDTWSDQSGNGNNATGAGATRPTLTVGTANSGILPSVTFNGTSHLMSLPSGFSNLTSGYSAFVMLKPSSSVATGTPVVLGNTGPSDAALVKTVGTNAALYAYNSTTSSNVTTSSNPISTSAFQLLEATFTPGSSPNTGVGKVYVNGTQQATSSTLVQTLANISRTTNRIGASTQSTEYFGGDICEILVYSNPVSDGLRKSIESYMLSKYGVGNTPTLDAPVITPTSGTFLPQQQFIISQPQEALTYFRTDNIAPSTSDLFFYNNQNFFLTTVAPEFVPRVQQTSVIKALAKAPFWNDSPVATATYTMDNSTAPIARSGLAGWYRASDVTLSGSNVTTWQDISGSSNNATNGANQPTLVSGAVNGLPAVNFSGTQFLQLPAGMANFTSGMTVMAVAKPVSVSAGARIFDFGNGATSDNVTMSLPSTTGLTFSTYNGSTASSATASSGVTLGQFQLLEASYSGTNTATLYQNASQLTQSTTMQTLNNLTRNNCYLGQDSAGGNRLNGQIAELLIWNRQLTVAERTAAEGYLLSKYQLLSTNAVAAPSLSVATSTLTAPAQVAIAGPNGAKIYWTNDGSTPTTSSNLYVGPVNVAWTQTLKAVAVLNGITSSVSSSVLTLDSTKWPSPSASDARTLNLEQQLPNVGIPHDANQP
ncbi:MAG TPA: hypothetical protein EYN91_08335 [Candidatus Melainabacteria bacterium]|nr:hypothetical protein [Candidatus Melainabacteria bacterium]HIN63015.1 hypothetical protein [Candidatus Obscuribacterales bacterium]